MTMRRAATELVYLLLSTSLAIAADNFPDRLVGKDLCAAANEYHVNGSFVPFGKDPTAFLFGDVSADGRRYVLVVKRTGPNERCGEIVAAMEVPCPLHRKTFDSMGFNCAVLEQPYDRHKAYLGIYEANALEYTAAKIAWAFDFTTRTFTAYERANNVYCANFVAD
ncbi:MAG: hypothetical protein HY899_15090 [Deltaproteobacteria bacterium]|nr:hypothetical protein [Deltaproteobacteria bacterium]